MKFHLVGPKVEINRRPNSDDDLMAVPEVLETNTSSSDDANELVKRQLESAYQGTGRQSQTMIAQMDPEAMTRLLKRHIDICSTLIGAGVHVALAYAGFTEDGSTANSRMLERLSMYGFAPVIAGCQIEQADSAMLISTLQKRCFWERGVSGDGSTLTDDLRLRISPPTPDLIEQSIRAASIDEYQIKMLFIAIMIAVDGSPVSIVSDKSSDTSQERYKLAMRVHEDRHANAPIRILREALQKAAQGLLEVATLAEVASPHVEKGFAQYNIGHSLFVRRVVDLLNAALGNSTALTRLDWKKQQWKKLSVDQTIEMYNSCVVSPHHTGVKVGFAAFLSHLISSGPAGLEKALNDLVTQIPSDLRTPLIYSSGYRPSSSARFAHNLPTVGEITGKHLIRCVEYDIIVDAINFLRSLTSLVQLATRRMPDSESALRSESEFNIHIGRFRYTVALVPLSAINNESRLMSEPFALAIFASRNAVQGIKDIKNGSLVAYYSIREQEFDTNDLRALSVSGSSIALDSLASDSTDAMPTSSADQPSMQHFVSSLLLAGVEDVQGRMRKRNLYVEATAKRHAGEGNEAIEMATPLEKAAVDRYHASVTADSNFPVRALTVSIVNGKINKIARSKRLNLL